MSDLYIAGWGEGAPAVLVHGSFHGGEETFTGQRPLADAGYRLLLPDRRGHGRSPEVELIDFETDAADVAGLLGEGAHLVGYSYGGVVALLAAAAAPERVRSLALLEPSAFSLVRGHPAVEATIALVEEQRRGYEGTPERPFWEAEIPVAALRAAKFPKLVVTGTDREGIGEAMHAAADSLAAAVGAPRVSIPDAGHLLLREQPQAVNAALLDLWARRRRRPG